MEFDDLDVFAAQIDKSIPNITPRKRKYIFDIIEKVETKCPKIDQTQSPKSPHKQDNSIKDEENITKNINFLILPNEIILRIASFIQSTKTLLNFGQTCKTLNEILSKNECWEWRFADRWNIKHSTDSIKDEYLELSRIETSWQGSHCIKNEIHGSCGVICCVKFFGENGAISAGQDLRVRVWNLEQKSEICSLNGHLKTVWSIDLYQRDKIVSCGGDGKLLKWDIERQSFQKLFSQSAELWKCKVQDDIVYVSNIFGAVNAISLKDRSIIHIYQDFDESVFGLDTFDHYLLTGGTDGNIIMYDVRMRKALLSIHAHDSKIFSVQFLNLLSGLQILSSSQSVKIFDVKKQRELDEIDENVIYCFQADSSKLVTGSMDSKIKIFDYLTKQCMKTIHVLGPVFSLEFKDTKLLTGGQDYTLTYWQFEE